MLLAMYKWKLIKKDEGLYTAPNFDTKIRTMFGMVKRKSKYTFYTLQFRVAMIENWPRVHIVNYSNENKCTKNDLPKFNMCICAHIEADDLIHTRHSYVQTEVALMHFFSAAQKHWV